MLALNDVHYDIEGIDSRARRGGDNLADSDWLTGRTLASLGGALHDARFLFYARMARHLADHEIGRSVLPFLGDAAAPEDLWRRNVLDLDLSGSADALTPTAKSVFQCLLESGERRIDLAELPERVNGKHLAVVLRATYSMKESVNGWEQALDLARRALLASDGDADQALYGLDR